ncbi:hypothetical protein, variant [Aphanomyces invadans]|uniref:AAA+ ATPase domain-containing protein n=1 Tax=Aphanomyces invadans TaxID=157072 RepID=A0A024UQ12_9STRA|nr:hypothetical protein H310_02181 [Aphanomyces invadans]XP_008863831.1 hypothetical protein, variant [Aphanomyces invadans]ETW07737.1 hypothetical protein H310_02181 [Aphanomyces invadans]ETW07738.1 hypothetical protein, variant [Aphanomyces invadans]|eukprot:XP_008863830.1 hypothetical protein H310_02181 [Aphanomyces invadans]
MALRGGGVLQLYQSLVKRQALRPDTPQQVVAAHLDKLQRRLLNYDLPKNMKGPTKIPRGLYIYGQVGTGKSMLMDLFYSKLDNKKRRVHFHAFLLEVHRRIHQRKQEHLETYGRSMHIELQPERDIIGTIAKEIAAESPVLCFDEFQVIDIADAMIMRKFFSVLFQQGTVMVATSNTHPQNLYPDGVNREYFLPFLDLLQQHTKVLSIDSTIDHRRHDAPMEDSYFTPVTPEVQKQVQAIVDALLEGRPPLQLETIPVMMGRTLQVKGQGDICVVDFATLCNTEKGAADYKALSERFRVVVLTDIPQMTLAMHNQARRFITLLDELYEHKVRLICTADVEPDELFNFDIDTAKVPLPVSLAMKQTELRNLQANHIKPFTSWDGPVAHDPATSSSDDRVKNMSSMTDLLYACKRAVSRLHEMRTSKYQLHFPNADT